MDRCKLEKETFVNTSLAHMLSEATGGFVASLSYRSIGDDEIVRVTTIPGRWVATCFDVNVSCDSLWAIAKDVMKAVGERYE